ncbi:MAG: glycosyltransferase [Deltaproteobacteria bacterium]|nr:glycosyltransferase [Deltaproteobacteria bacterium]
MNPHATGIDYYLNQQFHEYFLHVFEGISTKGKKLLEVGCALSIWLPYFATEFGFEVTGLDYSEPGCRNTEKILQKEGIAGNIICADLLDPPNNMTEAYDVVISFGLVEHFENTAVCLLSLKKFLKKRGLLITFIPNMVGITGFFQKMLNREIYDIHVIIDVDDLNNAHSNAALRVDDHRYFLSINSGVINLDAFKKKSKLFFFKKLIAFILFQLTKLVWLFETMYLSLPASRLFSPYIVCTARNIAEQRTPVLLPKKSRILYVIGSLGLGGAEKQLAILIEHIMQLNFSCQIFVLEPIGPMKAYLKNIRVPIHDGGYFSEKPPIMKLILLISVQLRLLRTIRAIRPDVIHAYLPLTNFLASLAGRLSGIPLIISSRRALGTHQERHRGWRFFDIISFYLSHIVTVNSKAVATDTIKRDLGSSAKLSLIYNGIDSDPFISASKHRSEMLHKLGISPKEKIIIVVANLIPYKGHADLIEAMVIVFKRFPNCNLLLVGEDRGIHDDLQKKAHVLGILKKIKFMGQRRDVADLMAAADLSVLPSHEEGFSNVILESMAAALPVVATNVGGNSEAVLNGITGWLVEPNNPENLAEKIIDLLGDPIKAREWGRRGRKRVIESFYIEKMIKAYLRLYHR